jgi:hypothetical protein
VPYIQVKFYNIALQIKIMSSKNTIKPLFNKENYLLMIVGGVIILLGIILMNGGKSADPNVFNKQEVYSTTRITIAPMLIILGLCVEIFAIFYNKKQKA